MNVIGFELIVGLKYAYKVDNAIGYDKPKTGQVFIFVISHEIEMRDLNHHLLCPMQCHMNGVVINKDTKLLAPVPSETMYVIQIMNSLNATLPVIILIQLTTVI